MSTKVFKDGLLVDPAKIVVIFYLPNPTSVCEIKVALGHTSY